MRTLDRHASDEMLHLIDRMIVEYSGAVPAGVVMRCVARTRRDLISAGVADDLASMTESVARRRLAERAVVRLAS